MQIFAQTLRICVKLRKTEKVGIPPQENVVYNASGIPEPLSATPSHG